MQKFIAKYGLAAHLAILAVAPLFLFPFLDVGSVVVVLLWLSFAAAFWTLLEPSVLSSEHLSDARRRVWDRIRKDPLFWALTAVLLVALGRALNGGISLAYDAEVSHWRINSAILPVFPGSVGSSGWLPFSAVLSSAVLMLGCRHSLGRSARMSFLLLSSSLAGLAACVSLIAVRLSDSCAEILIKGTVSDFSSVGFVCGLYLLAGTVSLVVVHENDWKGALFCPVLAVGGCGAGLFSLAPAYVTVPFVCAEAVLLVYGFFYSKGRLQTSDMAKMLVLTVASLAFAGLFAAAVLPAAVLDARLGALSSWPLFPENFWNVRAGLSRMAFKSWITHLWIGTGIGSFPIDFRFFASAEDWVQMPMGARAVANGWWLMLAERGIVGVVAFLLAPCFLLVAYGRRLVGCFAGWKMPHPACLLAMLSVILFGLLSFVDCSPMRAEVLMALGAVLAISVASFPRRK